MCDLYMAAEKTLASMRDDLNSGIIDVEALTKLVKSSYFVFCSLATADAISNIKCSLSQLIVDTEKAGIIDFDTSASLQNRVNSSFADALKDIKVPTTLAVKIKCLLQEGTLSEIDFNSTRDLSDVATLFGVPSLLKAYAESKDFKDYLYSMLILTRHECEQGALQKDPNIMKALRLGTLAGVYTPDEEQMLSSYLEDESTFFIECKKTVYKDSDLQGTDIFGG